MAKKSFVITGSETFSDEPQTLMARKIPPRRLLGASSGAPWRAFGHSCEVWLTNSRPLVLQASRILVAVVAVGNLALQSSLSESPYFLS
jgi:hypothetical protein